MKVYSNQNLKGDDTSYNPLPFLNETVSLAEGKTLHPATSYLTYLSGSGLEPFWPYSNPSLNTPCSFLMDFNTKSISGQNTFLSFIRKIFEVKYNAADGIPGNSFKSVEGLFCTETRSEALLLDQFVLEILKNILSRGSRDISLTFRIRNTLFSFPKNKTFFSEHQGTQANRIHECSGTTGPGVEMHIKIPLGEGWYFIILCSSYVDFKKIVSLKEITGDLWKYILTYSGVSLIVYRIYDEKKLSILKEKTRLPRVLPPDFYLKSLCIDRDSKMYHLNSHNLTTSRRGVKLNVLPYNTTTAFDHHDILKFLYGDIISLNNPLLDRSSPSWPPVFHLPDYYQANTTPIACIELYTSPRSTSTSNSISSKRCFPLSLTIEDSSDFLGKVYFPHLPVYDLKDLYSKKYNHL